MNVLIVEDEQPAVRQLTRLFLDFRPGGKVLAALDSVEGTLKWWQAQTVFPDLIFLDIQLADGLSFDIFRQAQIDRPVIFTTAYDQYTLRAFKLNSVDYLLKPIDPEELRQALDKYDRLQKPENALTAQLLEDLRQSMAQPPYKSRFLVKSGQQLVYIPVEEARYFFSEDGLVFLLDQGGKRHIIDYTLDQLVELLHPHSFYRVNRKLITHIDAIRKIAPYFNSRLILELHPRPSFEVIVSRDRVADFKRWLDR